MMRSVGSWLVAVTCVLLISSNRISSEPIDTEVLHRVTRSDKLQVSCNHAWRVEEQSFDVTIQWTVSSSVAVNTIDKFVVELKQFEIDATTNSKTYISGSYVDFEVQGETDTYTYSSMQSGVTPKKYPSIVGDYLIVPHFTVVTTGFQESCEFSLSPTPPSATKDLVVKSSVIITDQALNKHLAQINVLNIEWTVPSTPIANVSSLGYQLWVGANSSEHGNGDVFNVENVMTSDETTYSGNVSNFEEHYVVESGSSNLYIKLRCYYEVTFDMQYSIYSEWSDTLAVMIQAQIMTQTSSIQVSTASQSQYMSQVSTASQSQYMSQVSTASQSQYMSQVSTASQYIASIVTTSSFSIVQPSDISTLATSNTVEATLQTSENELSVLSSLNALSSQEQSLLKITSSALYSSMNVVDVNPSAEPLLSNMILLIPMILTPIIMLLILLIIIVIIILLCVRRRRNFRILSYQLDSSLSYNEEDDLIFKARSQPSITISHENLLETSLESCDEWELPAKSVIITKRLGEGCFGEVFKGEIKGFTNTHIISYQSRQDKERSVAIKVLKTNASNQEKNEFLKEIELMKVIAAGKNPHVVNMIGAVTRQEPMCVVTEFLEHGDLLSYLKDCRKKISKSNDSNGYVMEQMPEAVDLVSFAYQIASGMEYLSSLKIIHRDLACRNILVGEGKILKVSDFGLSRNMTYDSAYVKTTNGPLPMRWMAIESIMYHEFTTASDVWSFGITLWEIGTLGVIPYPNIDNSDILRNLQTGLRIDKPRNVSDEVYKLMLECCSENPSERPTFSMLRKRFDSMLSKDSNAKELYLDLNSFPEARRSIQNSPSPMTASTSNVYVETLPPSFSSLDYTPMGFLSHSTTPTVDRRSMEFTVNTCYSERTQVDDKAMYM